MDPKSIKDPIKRNKTENKTAPTDFLKTEY